jgi:hypothetical protein
MHCSLLTLSVFVLVSGQSLPVNAAAIRTQYGQTREFQQKCPVISVSCPSDVKDGEPITFTANLSGGNPNVVPVYHWEVSTGRIIQGQGTASIKLDMTGFGGHSPTATVTISGFDAACSSTASCSLIIEHWNLNPRKFDSYGALPRKSELGRLNGFAVQLKNQPKTQGYILAYGGRRGRAGAAQEAAARAKIYLLRTRGIEEDRIITVDAGFKEKLTLELWIVPSGANPPQAEPTVDPSE